MAFTPEQVEALVAKGDLKDPILIAKLRADAAAASSVPVALDPNAQVPTVEMGMVNVPQFGSPFDANGKPKPYVNPAAADPVYGGAYHDKPGWLPKAQAEAPVAPGLILNTDPPQPKTKKPAEPAPVEIAPQVITAPSPAPAVPSGMHVMPDGSLMPNAAMGGAPKGGGGAPAPKPAPVDATTFGMNKYDLAVEAGQVGHLKNTQALQAKASAADLEQAEAFEGIAQNVVAKYELEAQKAEQAAKRRNAFLTEFNNETNRKIEEYANSKVDANRYWHDKGAGGTLLAAIGVGLSGYAQSLAAGAGKQMDNGALQMIEQGIARDIELQKADIARKGAGIEARKGLYAQYLQQFGDEATAEQMAMETYLRKAKAEIDAVAAKTASQQVKVNAEAMKEAIDFKIEQLVDGRMARATHLYDDYKAKQDALLAQQQQAYANELKKRNEAVFKMQGEVATELAKKIGGVPSLLQTPVQLPNGAVIPAGSVVVLNKNGQIDMNGTEQVQKISTVNVPVIQPGGQFGYQPMPVNSAGFGDAAKKASGAAGAIAAIERMEKAAAMPGPWTGQKLKDYKAALSDYVSSYAVSKGMAQVSESEGERVKATVADAPTWLVGYLSDAQKQLLANQKKAIADEAMAAATVAGPAGSAPAPLTTVGAPQ